jgi:hypothetical protein
VVFSGEDEAGPFEVALGAVDKIAPQGKSSGKCAAAGIDHCILILTYLYAYHNRPLGSDSFSPTFGWVWREFSGSIHNPNAKQMVWFHRLLREVDSMYLAIQRPGRPQEVHNLMTSSTEHAGLMNSPVLAGSRFKSMQMHPLFMKAVYYAEEARDIRFDVLRSLRHPIARSLYLWLPAMAYHNTADKPFVLLPETLADRLRLPPDLPPGRRLHRLGVRPDRPSPYAELDGKEMREGNVLRVSFVWSSGGHRLHAWAEGADGGPVKRGGIGAPHGALFESWIRGGGTRDDFQRRLAQAKPLNEDEERLLTAALGGGAGLSSEAVGLAFRNNESFFRQAKALLPPVVFFDLIADGKVFAESGARVTKSLDAHLRSIVLNEIEGKRLGTGRRLR